MATACGSHLSEGASAPPQARLRRALQVRKRMRGAHCEDAFDDGACAQHDVVTSNVQAPHKVSPCEPERLPRMEPIQMLGPHASSAAPCSAAAPAQAQRHAGATLAV